MHVTAEVLDMHCVSAYGASVEVLLEDVEVCSGGRCIEHVVVVGPGMSATGQEEHCLIEHCLSEHGYDDVEWLPTVF